MPVLTTNAAARLIAFYLPQFHPIPENDEWWGKGFTEWVPVSRAQILFKGHYQPHIPTELGFYDLRVPEVREAQAELARDHGVEGFAYWHYWFAGRRLLERPFNEVLQTGQPRLPFCLAWANHTWRSVWTFGVRNKKLVEQTYPGLEDYKDHFFDALLPAFADDRYITIEGKPLFFIYNPFEIPEVGRAMDYWRELAHGVGLKGLHLVGLGLPPERVVDYGFDASSYDFVHRVKEVIPRSGVLGDLQYRFRYRKFIRKPVVYTYKEVMPYLLRDGQAHLNEYPSVVPIWDNTPRAMFSGLVYHESTPELYRQHLRQAVEKVIHKPPERRVIFIKSWNEWGEGNYLEPELRYGREYLEVTRDEVCGKNLKGGSPDLESAQSLHWS